MSVAAEHQTTTSAADPAIVEEVSTPRVVRYFVSTYPWLSLSTVFLLAFAAASEALGLLTLIPLLKLAGDGIQGAETVPTEGVEAIALRVLETLGVPPVLEAVLVLFVALNFLRAALLLLAKREIGYATARITTKLRMQMLRAILNARWTFFARQPVGALTNAVGGEVLRVAQGFKYLTESAQHLLMALAFLFVAMTISPVLMALAGAGGLGIWLALQAFVKQAGRAGAEQTTLTRSLVIRLTDGMQSIRLLKATASEDAIAPLLEGETRELKRALQRKVVAKETLSALQEPIVAVCVAGVVYGAVRIFGLTQSELLVLTLSLARGLMAFNKVQRRYQVAAVESSAVFSLLDQVELAEANVETHSGTEPPSFDQSLAVSGIEVDFDGQRVLDGVSLDFVHGGITAITGDSGAGKTTLIDTLTGLVRPSSGDVVIDGRPLAELDLHAWRQQIGFVPQEPLLMHDSVRANVTLGDDSIDDAAVEQALRDALAWDFVSETPGGIHEPVGVRGARFSAGQRARIGLARALVRQPKLLILDEATAALDSDSERKVWEAMTRLRGKATIVAISHQPYLLSVADRIVRLEAGRAHEVRPEPVAAAGA